MAFAEKDDLHLEIETVSKDHLQSDYWLGRSLKFLKLQSYSSSLGSDLPAEESTLGKERSLAIQSDPKLTTKKQLMEFLGLTGYCR